MSIVNEKAIYIEVVSMDLELDGQKVQWVSHRFGKNSSPRRMGIVVVLWGGEMHKVIGSRIRASLVGEAEGGRIKRANLPEVSTRSRMRGTPSSSRALDQNLLIEMAFYDRSGRRMRLQISRR